MLKLSCRNLWCFSLDKVDTRGKTSRASGTFVGALRRVFVSVGRIVVHLQYDIGLAGWLYFHF